MTRAPSYARREPAMTSIGGAAVTSRDSMAEALLAAVEPVLIDLQAPLCIPDIAMVAPPRHSPEQTTVVQELYNRRRSKRKKTRCEDKEIQHISSSRQKRDIHKKRSRQDDAKMKNYEHDTKTVERYELQTILPPKHVRFTSQRSMSRRDVQTATSVLNAGRSPVSPPIWDEVKHTEYVTDKVSRSFEAVNALFDRNKRTYDVTKKFENLEEMKQDKDMDGQTDQAGETEEERVARKQGPLSPLRTAAELMKFLTKRIIAPETEIKFENALKETSASPQQTMKETPRTTYRSKSPMNTTHAGGWHGHVSEKCHGYSINVGGSSTSPISRKKPSCATCPGCNSNKSPRYDMYGDYRGFKLAKCSKQYIVTDEGMKEVIPHAERSGSLLSGLKKKFLAAVKVQGSETQMAQQLKLEKPMVVSIDTDRDLRRDHGRVMRVQELPTLDIKRELAEQKMPAVIIEPEIVILDDDDPVLSDKLNNVRVDIVTHESKGNIGDKSFKDKPKASRQSNAYVEYNTDKRGYVQFTYMMDQNEIDDHQADPSAAENKENLPKSEEVMTQTSPRSSPARSPAKSSANSQFELSSPEFLVQYHNNNDTEDSEAEWSSYLNRNMRTRAGADDSRERYRRSYNKSKKKSSKRVNRGVSFTEPPQATVYEYDRVSRISDISERMTLDPEDYRVIVASTGRSGHHCRITRSRSGRIGASRTSSGRSVASRSTLNRAETHRVLDRRDSDHSASDRRSSDRSACDRKTSLKPVGIAEFVRGLDQYTKDVAGKLAWYEQYDKQFGNASETEDDNIIEENELNEQPSTKEVCTGPEAPEIKLFSGNVPSKNQLKVPQDDKAISPVPTAIFGIDVAPLIPIAERINPSISTEIDQIDDNLQTLQKRCASYRSKGLERLNRFSYASMKEQSQEKKLSSELNRAISAKRKPVEDESTHVHEFRLLSEIRREVYAGGADSDGRPETRRKKKEKETRKPKRKNSAEGFNCTRDIIIPYGGFCAEECSIGSSDELTILELNNKRGESTVEVDKKQSKEKKPKKSAEAKSSKENLKSKTKCQQDAIPKPAKPKSKSPRVCDAKARRMVEVVRDPSQENDLKRITECSEHETNTTNYSDEESVDLRAGLCTYRRCGPLLRRQSLPLPRPHHKDKSSSCESTSKKSGKCKSPCRIPSPAKLVRKCAGTESPPLKIDAENYYRKTPEESGVVTFQKQSIRSCGCPHDANKCAENAERKIITRDSLDITRKHKEHMVKKYPDEPCICPIKPSKPQKVKTPLGQGFLDPVRMRKILELIQAPTSTVACQHELPRYEEKMVSPLVGSQICPCDNVQLDILKDKRCSSDPPHKVCARETSVHRSSESANNKHKKQTRPHTHRPCKTKDPFVERAYGKSNYHNHRHHVDISPCHIGECGDKPRHHAPRPFDQRSILRNLNLAAFNSKSCRKGHKGVPSYSISHSTSEETTTSQSSTSTTTISSTSSSSIAREANCRNISASDGETLSVGEIRGRYRRIV